MKTTLIAVILLLFLNSCNNTSSTGNTQTGVDTASTTVPPKTEPVMPETETSPEPTQPAPEQGGGETEIIPGSKPALNDTALESSSGAATEKNVPEKVQRVYPSSKGSLDDTAMEAPPHR